jgi:hypothetical protein
MSNKGAIKPFVAEKSISPVRKVIKVVNAINATTPSKSPVRTSLKSPGIKEPAAAQDAVSPRKSLNYVPKYEVKSLPNDVIDPIYENVDPISVTTKARIAQGSTASQVPGRKE